MTAAPVAIVTGAAQGIGRAIALRLARDGFTLALADLPGSQKLLDAVVGEVAAQSPAVGVRAFACDVRREEDVYALVDGAAGLGRVDVMVANAGIAPTDSFLDITAAMYDNLYEINVRGVLFCYQAAAKQMIKQGGGGKLIAACSVSGIETTIHQTAYCSSKFAVRAINQGASRELGKHGITANVYCPGPVHTQMWHQIDDDFMNMDGADKGALTKMQEARNPLGRCAQPEDIANLVSFLAGPDSNFVSGQALQVNGASWVS